MKLVLYLKQNIDRLTTYQLYYYAVLLVGIKNFFLNFTNI